MTETNSNQLVDDANRDFWNELCGTVLARQLGITDHSLASLKRFDDTYLGFYPYLLKHVPVHAFSGKRVLEVGLGYGTLGQKIAESGAVYQGLDIAQGPVEMMNYRLRLVSLPGSAKQGSMLQCPFEDESFDAVVSIGCFHHTGDLRRCVEETFRVLKPGGHAYVMVYNKFSYRNWLRWPLSTLAAVFSGGNQATTAEQRAAYDAAPDGVAAPETIFVSRGELQEMFGGFSEFSSKKENWGGFALLGFPLIPRRLLLGLIGPACGLDIYVEAVK